MPDIGLPEIAIIAVVIFFLFGAQRLPKLGRSLGQGISSFKRGLNEELADDEPEPAAIVTAEAELPAAEPAVAAAETDAPAEALKSA